MLFRIFFLLLNWFNYIYLTLLFWTPNFFILNTFYKHYDTNKNLNLIITNISSIINLIRFNFVANRYPSVNRNINRGMKVFIVLPDPKYNNIKISLTLLYFPIIYVVVVRLRCAIFKDQSFSFFHTPWCCSFYWVLAVNFRQEFQIFVIIIKKWNVRVGSGSGSSPGKNRETCINKWSGWVFWCYWYVPNISFKFIFCFVVILYFQSFKT